VSEFRKFYINRTNGMQWRSVHYFRHCQYIRSHPTSIYSTRLTEWRRGSQVALAFVPSYSCDRVLQLQSAVLIVHDSPSGGEDLTSFSHCSYSCDKVLQTTAYSTWLAEWRRGSHTSPSHYSYIELYLNSPQLKKL
jgi:hypothetical protein